MAVEDLELNAHVDDMSSEVDTNQIDIGKVINRPGVGIIEKTKQVLRAREYNDGVQEAQIAAARRAVEEAEAVANGDPVIDTEAN